MKWYVVDVQQICIDSEHPDFASASAHAQEMVKKGHAPGSVKVMTKPRVGAQQLDPRDDASWKPRRRANPGKVTRWSSVPPWGDTEARTEEIPDRTYEVQVDKSLPLHTEVQSLVFNRPMFTVSEAVRWAEQHGYVVGKVDESDRTIRIRQQSPDDFAAGTFRSKELRPGVYAVIAMRKGPHYRENPGEPRMMSRIFTDDESLWDTRGEPRPRGVYSQRRITGYNTAARQEDADPYRGIFQSEEEAWARWREIPERERLKYVVVWMPAHKAVEGQEQKSDKFLLRRVLPGERKPPGKMRRNPGELVIVNPAEPLDTSRAEQIYEMWHQKEPKRAFVLPAGCHENDALVCIGHAYDIEYRSGKWQHGNKTEDYIHDFSSRPKVYMLASKVGDVGGAEKTVGQVLSRARQRDGRFHVAELARPLRVAAVLKGSNEESDLKIHKGAQVYGAVDKKTVIIFDPKWKLIVIQGGKMHFDERGIVF